MDVCGGSIWSHTGQTISQFGFPAEIPDPNLGTLPTRRVYHSASARPNAEPITTAKPPQCQTNSPKEIVRDVR
jgi:hypothetical protein